VLYGTAGKDTTKPFFQGKRREGGILNSATLNTQRKPNAHSHVYPFSLHYSTFNARKLALTETNIDPNRTWRFWYTFYSWPPSLTPTTSPHPTYILPSFFALYNHNHNPQPKAQSPFLSSILIFKTQPSQPIYISLYLSVPSVCLSVRPPSFPKKVNVISKLDPQKEVRSRVPNLCAVRKCWKKKNNACCYA